MGGGLVLQINRQVVFKYFLSDCLTCGSILSLSSHLHPWDQPTDLPLLDVWPNVSVVMKIRGNPIMTNNKIFLKCRSPVFLGAKKKKGDGSVFSTGKVPTDREQMVLDLDTICFSVVINIGPRGGLDFTIALATPIDCWGILNCVFVGMWNLGWVSLDGHQKRKPGYYQTIPMWLLQYRWPSQMQSKRGISQLIFSSSFVKKKVWMMS